MYVSETKLQSIKFSLQAFSPVLPEPTSWCVFATTADWFIPPQPDGFIGFGLHIFPIYELLFLKNA
jgi:hypothetical protein